MRFPPASCHSASRKEEKPSRDAEMQPRLIRTVLATPGSAPNSAPLRPRIRRPSFSFFPRFSNSFASARCLLFFSLLLFVALPPAFAAVRSNTGTSREAGEVDNAQPAADPEVSRATPALAQPKVSFRGWKHGLSNRITPIVQVEDVLVSSGGIRRHGDAVYGEDARLRLGEPYPGTAALVNLLSRGPFPAGKTPRSSMTRPMVTAPLFVTLPFLLSAFVPACRPGECRRNHAQRRRVEGEGAEAAEAEDKTEDQAREAEVARTREVELELVQLIVKKDLNDAVNKTTREASSTWQAGAWWSDLPPSVDPSKTTPQQAATHVVQLLQGAAHALGPSNSFVYFFSTSTPRGLLDACASTFLDRNIGVFLHVPSLSAEDTVSLPHEAFVFPLATLGRSRPTPIPAVVLTYDVTARQTVTVDRPTPSLGDVSPELLGKLATQLQPRLLRVLKFFGQEPRAHGPLPVIFVRFRNVEIQQIVDPWHGHPSRYLQLQREGKAPASNNFARLTPVPPEEASGKGHAFDPEKHLQHAVPIMTYRTTVSAAAQAHVMNLISSADFAELAILTVKDLRGRGPLFQPATHEYVSALKSDWKVYVTLAKTPNLIEDKQLAETHELILRANEDFSAERMHCIKKYVLTMSQEDPLFDFTKTFCYNFPEVRYPSSAGGSEFVANAVTAGLALRELFNFTVWPSRSRQENEDEAQASGLSAASQHVRGVRLPSPHPPMRKEDRPASRAEEARRAVLERPLSGSLLQASQLEGQTSGDADENAESRLAKNQEVVEEGARSVDSEKEGQGLEAGSHGQSEHAEVGGREETHSEEGKGAAKAVREEENLNKHQHAGTVATFHGTIPEAFAQKMQENFGPRWISLLQLLGSVSLTNDYLRVLSWLASEADSDAMTLPARRLLVRRDAEVSLSLSAALRHHVAVFYENQVEGNLSHPVVHKHERQYKVAEEGLRRFLRDLVSYSSKK
uniref:Putative transmembrane protein n=1 Tax=Toxoplasma gondii COUG TaxID=1074873 RepID=A0A2G8XP59_TOXGO|nr:putative transmembrane protein [Toxoplasma gondii COUG]